MFPTEPVPEKIGAYKVIRRLAGTGSADVYLGRMDGPMGFQRVCALKLVANSIEGDVRLAEELAREAAICARLNHPAIVRMYDFFEYDRRLVLVLEHVEGADLERLIQHLARRRQKLGDDAVWYLAHQLAGALAHAHAATDENGDAAPVIHRNVQPENIVVSWDGQVRLTGFGLGKILGRSPDTVVGMVKGTPGFMAPEQARGERVTPRADVYGFAALIWSLLTGRRPPIDGTRLEAVSTLRKDIPREIAAAIDAALEPAPDRRKITCLELEQWLEKLTRVEVGKAELREKILLLRSTRAAAGEPSVAAPARGAKQPRRRLSVRQVRASQRPPGPGPLSVPPPPSTRPSLRPGAMLSDSPPESERPPRSLAGAYSEIASRPPPAAPPPTPPAAPPAPPPRAPPRAPRPRGGAAPRAPRPPAAGSQAPVSRRAAASDEPPKSERAPAWHADPRAMASDAWRESLPEVDAIETLLGESHAPAGAKSSAPAGAARPANRPPAPAAPPPAATATDEPVPAPAALPHDFAPEPARGAGAAAHVAPAPAALAAAIPPAPVSPPTAIAQPPLSPSAWRDIGEESAAGAPAVVVDGGAFARERAAPRSPIAAAAPKPLSALQSIGIAALTAAVVVAAGILLADRDPRPSPGVPIASAAATAVAPTTPAVVRSAAATTPAATEATAVAPTPPSTASAASPSPSAAPVVDAGAAGAGAGGDLPAGYGSLTVQFPAPADVFVNGAAVGVVNTPIKVICGRWFIRIGQANDAGRARSWVTRGTTVDVPCQAATTVEMRPGPGGAVGGR